MDKPIFTMMCGLPGSGKSYFTSELSKTNGSIVYSSDKIREELYGDENSQDNNEEVFKVLHKRIKDSLRNGNSVIYDATNINSKRRRAFVFEMKNINCWKVCAIVATPYEECIENNNNRDRTVPEEVIRRMYMNWNTPYWFEGWDNIIIKFNSQYISLKKTPSDFINNAYHFNQENPHHTMTLGEHCESVASKLYDSTLIFAGMLHDCGKPFTKTFTNCKGEKTEIAHYYNHQNVGAYKSLFYEYPPTFDPIEVSILVNLHMQPYFWEKDKENGNKTKVKFKKLWGEDLFNNVMKLHEADVNAH